MAYKPTGTDGCLTRDLDCLEASCYHLWAEAGSRDPHRMPSGDPVAQTKPTVGLLVWDALASPPFFVSKEHPT